MLSVKIAGISGVGKSTLAKKIVSHYPDISSMCFGEYLSRYGHAAQKEWEKFLEAQNGIIVIVEHLEIGDDDLLDVYRKENTKAIFLINPSVEEVIRRRKKDNAKGRKMDS